MRRPDKILMVINLENCFGCFACETACKLEKNLPDGIRLIRVMQFGPYSFKVKEKVKVKENGKLVEKEMERSKIISVYMPRLCFHCEIAPCIESCPTNAIKRDTNLGIVYIDEDLCIGCKQCLSACPYGTIQFDTERKKAIKCDFCYNRIKAMKEYSEEDIKKIYKEIINKGGRLKKVIHDKSGDIAFEVVKAKDSKYGGIRVKCEEMKEMKIEGLWTACATKCPANAIKIGRFQEIKDYLDKYKGRIKREWSIIYIFPYKI